MSEINVTSMVSYRTRDPMVSIYWPKDIDATQMTPDEARTFAMHIVEAAEAAEQDAFLFGWFTTTIGAEPHAAAAMLNEFRGLRDKWRNTVPDEEGPDGEGE